MIRKVVIGAFALFVTAGAVNAQTQFGIKGGYHAAAMTTDESGTKSKSLSSFNAGVVADIGITEMFSVRTGLDLQGKGTQWGVAGGTGKLNPLYLELPVTFTVNFPLGDATKLYAGAGPFVGVGVGGKFKTTGTFWGLADGERSLNFGNETGDDLKKVDGGVNVAGGLKFNEKFGLHVQYGIGLVNTAPKADADNRKNNTRTFGVSGIFYF